MGRKPKVQPEETVVVEEAASAPRRRGRPASAQSPPPTAEPAASKPRRARAPRSESSASSVTFDPSSSIFHIDGRHGQVALRFEAAAQAPSGRRYLLFSPCDEDPSEEHEQSLVSHLRSTSGQEWDIVDARLLHRRWSELSQSERQRLARREGFQVAKSPHLGQSD